MKIIQETKNKTIMKSNRGDIYEFTCIYPEENSPHIIEEITKGLAYAGVFNGIKRNNEQ